MQGVDRQRQKLLGYTPGGLGAMLSTHRRRIGWERRQQATEAAPRQPWAAQLRPEIEPVEAEHVGIDRPPELTQEVEEPTDSPGETPCSTSVFTASRFTISWTSIAEPPAATKPS